MKFASHTACLALLALLIVGSLPLPASWQTIPQALAVIRPCTPGYVEAPSSPVSVGRIAADVTVGDPNGDGDAEMGVRNNGANSESVLLGDGTGTFSPAPGPPLTGFAFPRSVTLADVNGDGDVDFAISVSDIVVMLGSGDDTFTRASDSTITGWSNPGCPGVRVKGDGWWTIG